MGTTRLLENYSFTYQRQHVYFRRQWRSASTNVSKILKYLHPSAEKQRPSRSTGTHGACAPVGRPPNRRDTKTFDIRNKLGAKEDRDSANHARYPTLHATVTRLTPQGQQRIGTVTARTQVWSKKRKGPDGTQTNPGDDEK